MPKRRVPGHINRPKRRRRDDLPRGSSTPITPAPHDDRTDSEPAASGGGEPTKAGQRLRPTQRIGAPTRFARSAVAPEIQTDYRYVVHDLRQIGSLAALAFVVLIGLSFVIR